MSTWRVRHEGSSRAVEGLTDAEVLQGVQDGLWEPTDEVMGPGDAGWKALEAHPHFAEAMADYEPPPPPPRPDETRLDMNPLIDVALVLLVFFILTTTYASLRRVVDMPPANAEDKAAAKSVPQITQNEIREQLILVKARPEGGRPRIWVEEQVVPQEELTEKLRETMRRTGKTQILVDVEGVPWGTEVAILDAAKGADVTNVLQKVKPRGK